MNGKLTCWQFSNGRHLSQSNTSVDTSSICMGALVGNSGDIRNLLVVLQYDDHLRLELNSQGYPKPSIVWTPFTSPKLFLGACSARLPRASVLLRPQTASKGQISGQECVEGARSLRKSAVGHGQGERWREDGGYNSKSAHKSALGFR